MGVPADSKNREMMVASSKQLTMAKVGLCDLTAQWSLLLRCNDRGESFPTVVHSILQHGRWSRMKDGPHVSETKLNSLVQQAPKQTVFNPFS